MVDGYGWPIGGIFDLNWQEKTKFRVDPGFYNAEVAIIINLDAYKSSRRSEGLPRQAALALEVMNGSGQHGDEEKARRRRPASRRSSRRRRTKTFVDKAYDAGWAAAMKTEP